LPRIFLILARFTTGSYLRNCPREACIFYRFVFAIQESCDQVKTIGYCDFAAEDMARKSNKRICCQRRRSVDVSTTFSQSTAALVQGLSLSSLFPLLDIWATRDARCERCFRGALMFYLFTRQSQQRCRLCSPCSAIVSPSSIIECAWLVASSSIASNGYTGEVITCIYFRANVAAF
jgi:hypothetical protein